MGDAPADASEGPGPGDDPNPLRHTRPQAPWSSARRFAGGLRFGFRVRLYYGMAVVTPDRVTGFGHTRASA